MTGESEDISLNCRLALLAWILQLCGAWSWVVSLMNKHDLSNFWWFQGGDVSLTTTFVPFTPRKINMEPWEYGPPGRGKSSSKASFSGSMLIFGGVHVDILGVGWIYLSRIMARVNPMILVVPINDRLTDPRNWGFIGKIQSIGLSRGSLKSRDFLPSDQWGFSGTPNDGTPLWEWYGKLTIRGSHYWGSLKFPLIRLSKTFLVGRLEWEKIKAVHFVELLQKHLKIGQSSERVTGVRCLWRVGLS